MKSRQTVPIPTRLALLVSAMLALAGCQPGESSSPAVRVATTTSYLESVARDLLGNDLSVLRLAEPGTCPGHFDIRPSQVNAFRQSRALLRFDFQKSLETKLAGDASNPLPVAEIALRTGLCCPDTYLSACQQTAARFVLLGLLTPASADARLKTITGQLGALSADLTNQVARAGLAGTPVLASSHQRDFCEWLGLNVVGTFRAADIAGVREIEAVIAAGKLASVKLVIANLPEGRRTADALADRLGTRVVVFENFPALVDGRVAFPQMLAANVRALMQATRR